jgi:cyclophilin family peptidyl-prolyl cis-trans isomerase
VPRTGRDPALASPSLGTEKRARQKAGRQIRIEQAEAARRKAQARNRVIGGLVVVVVGLLLVAGVVLLTRKDDATVSTATGPTSAPPGASIVERNGSSVPPEVTSTTVPLVQGVPAGASLSGDPPCPPADGSAARTTTFANAPPVCIDPSKKYAAKVSTTKGDFTIALDAVRAPIATNNFVVLSRYHYYDGVPFHRVIPGFVVQGGDATGNPPGTGGPGYKFQDELPSDPGAYKTGTVAMANSGPNTNGSQFYVVVAEGKLGAQYTVFGQVVEGYDTTVKAIEAGGTPSGSPSDPTAIKTVTIIES